MPRLAANLSWLFTEGPFLDRFAAAAEAGFGGVEWLFAYDQDTRELTGRLQRHGLQVALINAPPGDWDRGERGLAGLPGREDEFMASVRRAAELATAVGAPCVHVMAGLVPLTVERSRSEAAYLANLGRARDLLGRSGITVTIEPLNRRDMPGYLLTHSSQAREVVDALGGPGCGVALQADLYHLQIQEGDLTALLRSHLDYVGHVQVAGVPDRGEPDEGELRTEALLDELDLLGYAGWVGCEYRPATTTAAGLGWATRWLPGQRTAIGT